jgi:hypothetical protein
MNHHCANMRAMAQINLTAAHIAAQTQPPRSAPRPMTVGDFAELATKMLSPKPMTTMPVQPAAVAPVEAPAAPASQEPQRPPRPGSRLDIRV